MKKVYQIFCFITFLSISLLFNPFSYAAQGIRIGNAEISPYAEIKVQYDDNVFLSSSDEKDDFIYTLTPGIGVDWPFRDNSLKLDYHVNINRFLDNTSQDAVDHFASGTLDVPWRDVKFTFYDDFRRVFERPSTEDSDRVKRDDNRAGVTVALERERLGVQLGYENFIRNYRSIPAYDAYDRNDSLYSLMLTHQTFAKTKLLIEYDFGQIRYDQSTRSDSDYHQFLVGAIGELTPKTTATIKTGYQIRDYEDGDQPDFDTGVLYADAVHRFSQKNALKISFERTAYESTYGVNNFYRAENVTATFDHFFNTKLLGFLTGEYRINSYPRETTEGSETKKREDKYYSLGAGFKYYMKTWLSFKLHAEHITRDSNFGVYDYNENLVTLTARAEF
ncbi:MAG: outer membrane beta-barrel protein [Candidatus Omnitrophica bacterium]|nr:outer membrane beta-barrel protein [Candidatus Omnitrophota bacterium]MBU1932813.1 outer membrane beta-barrel protein [Candidatus Omnitrophota bacterium]